jgi:hypothetical protein
MSPSTVSTSAPAVASPFSSRRTFGRAPSPPIWACYEQIPYDEGYSEESDDSDDGDDNSCSEDDEDYEARPSEGAGEADTMDIDEAGDRAGDQPKNVKDLKGKQRAVDPEPESPPKVKKQDRKKKRHQPVFNLRPILTIQKSQGFVWNQVGSSSIADFEANY